MARKPNYQFERKERERAKTAKLAEKAAAKRDRAVPVETPDATVPETEG